jgi:predicted transcriptional regulator
MTVQSIKAAARDLIDKLPEGSTWDDLIRGIYLQQTIEAGLADSAAGRVKSVAEVRSMFGWPE